MQFNYRCQFPIEAFNSVNEVTKYLKDVTSSNIICSLSMVDLKTYLEMKYETYMAHGVPRLFNSAEYLGLQNNGTIVFSRQVCCTYCTVSLYYQPSARKLLFIGIKLRNCWIEILKHSLYIGFIILCLSWAPVYESRWHSCCNSTIKLAGFYVGFYNPVSPCSRPLCKC